MSSKRSLPRRTIELPTDLDVPSTAKKTTRLSRIAQPIRRTQSIKSSGNDKENQRSISQERGSYMPQYSAIKPRSSSATPMRNAMAKTPLKTTTPMNRSRTPSTDRGSLVAMSTVEKINRRKAPTDDKEWIYAQKIKILEKMKSINGISQQLLDKGDFRDMSVKQFLVFMTQILKEIGGNRYKITPISFADDIAKYLNEFGYPYTFNKSMLKTPNADHSINNIITMMSWLMSLTACSNPIDESEVSYSLSRELHNADFTVYFFQQAGNSFVLWNEKRDDEFEQAMNEIHDEMAKSGSGMDLNSLEKECEDMEKELAAVNQHSDYASSRKKSFLSVEKELEMVQQNKIAAMENCKIKERMYQQLHNSSLELQEQIDKLRNSADEVKKLLEKQKMSVKDREAILTSISEQQNILQAKKKSVCELEQMSSEKQVIISRIIKEKFDLLRDLNHFIIKLDSDLKHLIDFNCKPLQMQFSETDIENLSIVFKEIDTIHSNLKAKYTSGLNELKHNLAMLELIRRNNQEELNDLEKEQQESVSKRDQLHDEYTKGNSESRRRIEELQKILDDLHERNEGYEAVIKRNEQTINVLKTQTEMAITDSLAFMDDRIEEKENSIRERAKQCQMLNDNGNS